jgi:hypothetical protein
MPKNGLANELPEIKKKQGREISFFYIIAGLAVANTARSG